MKKNISKNYKIRIDILRACNIIVNVNEKVYHSLTKLFTTSLAK